jgi:hypothetical protein
LNRQDRIRKLLKPGNLLILGTATIIYLTICIFQVSALTNKSYILTRSDVFSIDSVKMLSRAFQISTGTKTSSRSIEFQDEKYKTFSIDGIYYDAIVERQKLYDTLQYSELLMQIFTDKNGYHDYFEKRNNDKIKVYGIMVGNKSFMSLDSINKKERDRRISILIYFSVAYSIFLLIYLVRVLRTTKSVQQAVLQ